MEEAYKLWGGGLYLKNELDCMRCQAAQLQTT